MKSIDTIKSRLLDIELPAAPPPAIDYMPMLIAIGSLLIIVAVIIYYLRSRTFVNKRLLAELKRQLISSQLSAKQASYMIADILKSSQQTKHLNASENSPPEWHKFVNDLSELRYQPTVSKDKTLKLIDDAKYWLKVPQ